MLNEKTIKTKIIEKLKELDKFAVRDFPIVISDYKPTHPRGELLIKSLGKKPSKYIDRSKRMNPLFFGDFVIMEYQFRIELISSKILSQDDIFDLTEEVTEKMKSLHIEQSAGSFYLSETGEIFYDDEKHFQHRTMLFFIPVIEMLEVYDE
ncbi:MAG: hypothetical protein KIT33_15220 [Candidatus Kapabacteria bacterium]|nr:hypothetical protein [Ignavibacteriota bacterium]MCW5886320.1 hypothetical protein [Candidatus Kapabacteria bacterium]